MKEIFYVPDVAPGASSVSMAGSTARHVSRVLRHRPGDRIMATDGRGTEFALELTAVSSSRVVGRVLGQRLRPREPRRRVALAQALLRGDKLAQVVEAVTELGVSEIIPFVSERTVARLGATRQRRLQHVAVSGLETSMRTVLPAVGASIALDELPLRFSEFERVVVAYEAERSVSLADLIPAGTSSVLAVVGPEGGFSDGEIGRLRQAGVGVFSLGPRRLRAETAATVVVALCLQRLGDLG